MWKPRINLFFRADHDDWDEFWFPHDRVVSKYWNLVLLGNGPGNDKLFLVRSSKTEMGDGNREMNLAAC